MSSPDNNKKHIHRTTVEHILQHLLNFASLFRAIQRISWRSRGTIARRTDPSLVWDTRVPFTAQFFANHIASPQDSLSFRILGSAKMIQNVHKIHSCTMSTYTFWEHATHWVHHCAWYLTKSDRWPCTNPKTGIFELGKCILKTLSHAVCLE